MGSANTSGVSFKWPEEGVARVPYFLFSDEDIYAQEQKAIFRGPIWQFLGLEVQLPDSGSYILVQIGDTPVIVVRDENGEISALVNRCTHKGTPLVYTPSGKLDRFMCIYHNWCFDLQGELKSVSFEKGVRGKGGMSSFFQKSDHGLERLRVHTESGLIFGTFSDDTPDFETFVGPDLLANLRRVCNRPFKVLGQYSQYLNSNWKLYMENVKDPYHASILHAFLGVMKLNRMTMDGAIKLGTKGWHHLSYSKIASDVGGEVYENSAEMRSSSVAAQGYGLRDKSIIDMWDDHGDGISLAIQTIFPNFVLQQIFNSLAVRTLVPRGPRASELMWTVVGYADDSEERTAGRLLQGNLIGPAGLISMEDGMIGALIQNAIEGDKDKCSVLEMDGRGVEQITGTRVSEAGVRGFWTGYRELMGV